MLEGIIFDADGTLLKTLERQYLWFIDWSKNMLSNSSKPLNISFDQFVQIYNVEIQKSIGVQAVYDHFGLDCDMVDKTHPVWAAYTSFSQKHPAQLYDGVHEAFMEIWSMTRLKPGKLNRNSSVQIGLNTTNSWSIIGNDLKHTGLIDYFNKKISKEDLEIFDEGNGEHIAKPSKVAVMYSLLQLGTTAKNTIYVGDSINDLKATTNLNTSGLNFKNVNLITVGCTWGYEGESLFDGYESKKYGRVNFNHIINHPSQLVEIVKKQLY